VVGAAVAEAQADRQAQAEESQAGLPEQAGTVQAALLHPRLSPVLLETEGADRPVQFKSLAKTQEAVRTLHLVLFETEGADRPLQFPSLAKTQEAVCTLRLVLLETEGADRPLQFQSLAKTQEAVRTLPLVLLEIEGADRPLQFQSLAKIQEAVRTLRLVLLETEGADRPVQFQSLAKTQEAVRTLQLVLFETEGADRPAQEGAVEAARRAPCRLFQAKTVLSRLVQAEAVKLKKEAVKVERAEAAATQEAYLLQAKTLPFSPMGHSRIQKASAKWSAKWKTTCLLHPRIAEVAHQDAEVAHQVEVVEAARLAEAGEVEFAEESAVARRPKGKES